MTVIDDSNSVSMNRNYLLWVQHEVSKVQGFFPLGHCYTVIHVEAHLPLSVTFGVHYRQRGIWLSGKKSLGIIHILQIIDKDVDSTCSDTAP